MDVLTISALVFWSLGLIGCGILVYRSIRGKDGKFD